MNIAHYNRPSVDMSMTENFAMECYELIVAVNRAFGWSGYFRSHSRMQCNQSFLGCQGNGFGAIGGSELPHDRTDVELGGTFTDH